MSKIYSQPEPYFPKSKIYPPWVVTDRLDLLCVRCTTCKLPHVYYPADLLQILGDVDANSLMGRMSCEGCGVKGVVVRIFVPSGPERVGLKIRKLVSVKIR